MPKILGRLLSGVAVCALSAGVASAAGFAIKEQGAKGQGMSFAGSSVGLHGISNMYFNPAAISFHEGFRSSLNSAIILPNAEVSNSEGVTATGADITGGDADSSEIAFVPSVYLSAQANEWVTFGLSVNAPFGLVTEYDRNWAGRYHAVRSELTTITVTPVVSVRPIPEIAIAGGPVIQYVDAELTNAVDFGTIGAASLAAEAEALGAAAAEAAAAGDFATAAALGAEATATGDAALAAADEAGGGADGFGGLEGDDFGYGFALGAIFQPRPSTRIGVGFRSEIKHTLDGEASFDYDDEGIGDSLNAAGDLFTNGTGGKADFTSPAQVNIGISHAFNERFTLAGEAQWTQWSSFEELRIRFDDETPDSVTEENWNDQWFFALGGEYKATDALTLRAGVAYDEGATPDETRTPRIPDADRFWVSLGASYEITNVIEVGAGYSFIYVDDSTIDLKTDGTDDNASRGSFSADVEADVHILAVSGKVKF